MSQAFAIASSIADRALVAIASVLYRSQDAPRYILGGRLCLHILPTPFLLAAD